MGKQMKAERLKRASILEAEGLRQSEILRAEGAQQAAILEAEGKKEAAYREADARVRAEQAALAVAVESALASGDHLVAEAGTGTGKSLAYLIPALESGRRVVVSTATKAVRLWPSTKGWLRAIPCPSEAASAHRSVTP